MRRRGLILISVLVIIAIGALVGTTLLYRAQVQRAGVTGAQQRMQLRALAWSGVQGVAAELQAQRAALLAGGEPALSGEWTLFELGDQRGAVRLVPVLRASTSLAAAMNERLDVNVATTEMIAKLPGMDSAGAGQALGKRGGGWTSDEEVRQASATLLGEAGSPHATVFGFDAELSAGGVARVKLTPPWAPETKAYLSKALGDGVAAEVEKAIAKPDGPRDVTGLVRLLQSLNVPFKARGTVLDGATFSDDDFHAGRVDINRASAGVLATIPGVTTEVAQKIVEARGRVSQDERTLISWPLEQRLMDAAAFEAASPWISTRSLVWAVRVEATLDRGGEMERASDGAADGETNSGPRMIFEAVIDATMERPRVAYLRDVTYRLAVGSGPEAEEVDEGESLNVLDNQGPMIDSGEVQAAGESAGPDASLRTQGLKVDGLKANGMRMSTDLSLGGLSLSPGSPQSGIDRSRSGSSKAVNENGGGANNGGANSRAGEKSRRVGRWTGGD